MTPPNSNQAMYEQLMAINEQAHTSIYASLVRQIETSELLQRQHRSHPEPDR